ncbi:MAG: Gfo/Idh/MocA family oxidoreductase [Acidobacteria bacterium]|nr:Gfo/Idh/MocA family oxidoreductase [Acidobacteriota bacterium]
MVNRRGFVAATAAAGASLLGADERIRLGVIGTGGRGTYLTEKFREQGAEVNGVCDVYEPHLAQGLKAASPGAKGHVDYRRLLEDKSLDAVIVATPDHLHPQIAIDALDAGKDLYLEKPIALKVDDGFRIVDAVRRNKRIAQVGSQRRSYFLHQEAKGVLDSGQLGEVHLITVTWLNYWRDITARPLTGKLDWERFLGPAPKREPDPIRFFNWLFFRDYAGGTMIGQAAHIVDSVNWMMRRTYPVAVTATMAPPNVKGAENPDTSTMTVEYPDNLLMTFTLGYRAMHYNFTNDQMQQFHGTRARLDVGRESVTLYPHSEAVEMKAADSKHLPKTFEPASHAHVRNFLDCVRSRQEPNTPIEAGQSTNIILAMAVESMWTGRRVRWNQAVKRIET